MGLRLIALDSGQCFLMSALIQPGVGTGVAVAQEKSSIPPCLISACDSTRGGHSRKGTPQVHMFFGSLSPPKYVSPKPIERGCEHSNMLSNVDPENGVDIKETYCRSSVSVIRCNSRSEMHDEFVTKP